MDVMRVLIAPDKFAGTLSAPEAAAAIAEGWRRHAPADQTDLAPMSDGGPGFVEVLHASLGGTLLPATVEGPYGEQVPGAVLLTSPSGEGTATTAYVESAQACGLHLTPVQRRDPERASSHGVGELVRTAVEAGATRVVVGLGGSGTNDGGAGLLAALGAVADPPDALRRGAEGLSSLDTVHLDAPRSMLSAVSIEVASDVDNPLLGLTGATNVYGAQKGLVEERKVAVDAMLARLAAATDTKLARSKGAGAAGGLGFALMLLGATRRPGVHLVADALDLGRRAADADLVVTGEGAFDFSSRSGKVPYGVAQVATAAIRPCIALAGKVLVGSREMRALGVESAYAMVDLVGERASFDQPYESLAALSHRVARSWSP